ncbi:hypothetical protein Tco_0375376 [Tanacetum coccineum]
MLFCPRLLLPFRSDGSLYRHPGSSLNGIPKSTHILHPPSLFFTMTGIATHFVFRVEGFSIDLNGSRDPRHVSMSPRRDIRVGL